MQNKIVLHRGIFCGACITVPVMNNNMALHQHRDKSKNQRTFFKMLKCGYFVVYPSVCLHASVRKCVQTLAWWSESDCVGMHKSVCVCVCVCVCARLCAGLPTIPLINSSCGLANDCSSPACLSLCLALISSWQHHMRDEWTLAQNGITRLLAVIRSHIKKWMETEEVIKREKRGRDSPHLSRFN